MSCYPPELQTEHHLHSFRDARSVPQRRPLFTTYLGAVTLDGTGNFEKTRRGVALATISEEQLSNLVMWATHGQPMATQQ
jgi:hypothetical protein